MQYRIKLSLKFPDVAPAKWITLGTGSYLLPEETTVRNVDGWEGRKR